MSRYRARYLEASPGMFIALVTFILAISLEKLVDQVVEIAGVTGSSGLLACYLVGASIFLGILMTWLAFSQMFTLLDPIPHPTQAFVPFGIGLLQFTAIAFLAPDTLRWALLTIGIAHSTGGFVMSRAFTYLRVDPENRRVTERFARSWAVILSIGLGFVQVVAAAAVNTVVLVPLLLLALGTQVALVATWSISWWHLMRREEALTSAA